MMPRPMVSMAKIEAYEDKIIGPLLRSFDSIPVNRGAADLSALRRVLDALEAGLAVLIAPEGHRSETGGLGEAHEGIAFVAYRAKVPIVPVGISGTPAFKHNYWKMKKTHVTYRFGQPFTLDAGGERVTTEMLKQMTDEAMYQLAALLPPEQRGLYEDLDQATTKYVRHYSRWALVVLLQIWSLYRDSWSSALWQAAVVIRNLAALSSFVGFVGLSNWQLVASFFDPRRGTAF